MTAELAKMPHPWPQPHIEREAIYPKPMQTVRLQSGTFLSKSSLGKRKPFVCFENVLLTLSEGCTLRECTEKERQEIEQERRFLVKLFECLDPAMPEVQICVWTPGFKSQ